MTNQNLNEINEQSFKDLADKVRTISANKGIYKHSSENEFYQSSPSEKCKRILYNRGQKISVPQKLKNYNLRK